MEKYIITAIKGDVNIPPSIGGTAAQNASVTVKIKSTGALATIYSDNGVTVKTPPFQTDSNGNFEFYAANGRYTVEVGSRVYDDILLYDPGDVVTSVSNFTMTKSEFEALAEKRKRDSAGSGFLEWGKHYPNEATFPPVNNGIWSRPDTSSRIQLGLDRNATGIGDSRSDSPIALSNGVQHKISFVANTSLARNNITLPKAPDGTKTYNSATGIITTHASTAEAFEGNYKNGDFRNGSASWTFPAPITVTNGEMICDGSNGSALYTSVAEKVPYVHGQEYTVTITISEITSGNVWFTVKNGLISSPLFSTVGTHSWTFVWDSAYIDSHPVNFLANTAAKISSVSIRPSTESVITSRKDLVFLETWHEAIEDKDEVYPLGNVQYGLSSYEGITLTTRSDDYTRFGEWDTTTTGRYATWSALTDAQKLKFISNPENNIYYDEETSQFIQVRYRIRVIEGLGDTWDMDRVRNTTENGAFGYALDMYVRGSGANATVDLNPLSDRLTDILVGTNNASSSTPFTLGHWCLDKTSNSGLAYKNKLYALPIALVQRLNQGAYHPTYNPFGCDRWRNSAGSGDFSWWDTDAAITSTVDCFTVGKAHGGLGDISSGLSGRPSNDTYLYHDAIYAGQVEDLRLSARKIDYSVLLQDSFNKAVAATKRGKDKIPFTKVFPSVGAVEAGYTIVNQDNASAVVAEKYLTPEFDGLPWVDIIGDPVRIAATFPDGVAGQWVSTIPDGTTKAYKYNRKILGSSVDFIFTDDDGGTWSTSTAPITGAINGRSASTPSGQVQIFPYNTLSKFTQASDKKTILKNAELAFVGNNHYNNLGNRLSKSVIDEVMEGSAFDLLGVSYRALIAYRYNADKYAEVQSDIQALPSTSYSKAFRTVPYLVKENGLLYVQYLTQELYYNGTSWGLDANQQIRDSEGTYTDLNGFVLKSTCHTDLIPLGIADN